jgi:hypothetical protein
MIRRIIWFRLCSAVAVYTAFLALTGSGDATTLIYQSFDQLVDTTQHVVGGIIKEIISKRVGKKSSIYTIITIKDAYTVDSKGVTSLHQHVKIRYKGGKVRLYNDKGNPVGYEKVIADGTPKLRRGEQVILFICNNGKADMPINGWNQGVFKIDDSGGVHDSAFNPVVGLDGTDILTKTEQGLFARGNLLENRLYNPTVLSGAYIVNSDGGEDILSDLESSNAAKLNVLRKYSVMDKANFISMIQERKAIAEEKSIQNTATLNDLTSLFNLPEVLETKKVTIPMEENHNSVLKSGQSSSRTSNTEAGDRFLPAVRPKNSTPKD